MSRLRQLEFNFRSNISFDHLVEFPSNEQIRCTLTNCANNEVMSYVDYFPNERKGQCHIYTYPHQ